MKICTWWAPKGPKLCTFRICQKQPRLVGELKLKLQFFQTNQIFQWFNLTDWVLRRLQPTCFSTWASIIWNWGCLTNRSSHTWWAPRRAQALSPRKEISWNGGGLEWTFIQQGEISHITKTLLWACWLGELQYWAQVFNFQIWKKEVPSKSQAKQFQKLGPSSRYKRLKLLHLPKEPMFSMKKQPSTANKNGAQ